MNKKKGRIKKIIWSILAAVVVFIVVLIINLIIFEKKASIVSTGEPIVQVNETHPALLVVDIQEATTGQASLNQHYINESERLIQNINEIATIFKRQHLPVIYIRSEITNPLVNLLNSSFAKGSVGAELDQRLQLVSSSIIVKSRNDAFINTTLDDILEKNRVNTLYIVGLDAANCINLTTQAAQNRNYNIRLISEAILSESEEMKDSMFVEFRERNVEVLNLNQLDLIE